MRKVFEEWWNDGGKYDVDCTKDDAKLVWSAALDYTMQVVNKVSTNNPYIQREINTAIEKEKV